MNCLDDTERSQLDKYRMKAEAYAQECGKKARFYAFVPDRSSLDFKQFDPGSIYIIVPYSAIYKFFAHNAATYIADRHFPEFLRGLERQSLTMSELNFRTIRQRFMKKIKQAQ